MSLILSMLMVYQLMKLEKRVYTLETKLDTTHLMLKRRVEVLETKLGLTYELPDVPQYLTEIRKQVK